jgi:hypothetical protein
MTYEDTLINIIDVNNNLLKLKCSKKSDTNEIKLIKKVLNKQVESALLYKKSKVSQK